MRNTLSGAARKERDRENEKGLGMDSACQRHWADGDVPEPGMVWPPA